MRRRLLRALLGALLLALPAQIACSQDEPATPAVAAEPGEATAEPAPDAAAAAAPSGEAPADPSEETEAAAASEPAPDPPPAAPAPVASKPKPAPKPDVKPRSVTSAGEVVAIHTARGTIELQAEKGEGGTFSVNDSTTMLKGDRELKLKDLATGDWVLLNADVGPGGRIATYVEVIQSPDGG